MVRINECNINQWKSIKTTLINDKKEKSEFQKIAEKHRAHTILYGHLQGESSFNASIIGECSGVCYKPVSADYIDFTPIRVMK